MMDSTLQVGDILKLKSKYRGSGIYAVVLEINKAENFGPGGWISFDYVVMNEKEQIIHISEGCVEEILYSASVGPHSPTEESADSNE
tara:strand:+ start:52 stop:312 length:261 start_codon:yes stop_codon:yes gene_type:complete